MPRVIGLRLATAKARIRARRCRVGRVVRVRSRRVGRVVGQSPRGGSVRRVGFRVNLVLSAFSYVAGVLLFWTLIVAVRQADTPEGTIRLEPMAKVGNATIGVGAGGTIVLGIWLAFSVGRYDIWDGWIIAAIVLWLVSMELGRRTGAAYTEGMKKAQELQAAGQSGPSAELLGVNRTSRGLLLHSLSSIVVVLILVDMIWKPGA